MKTIGYVDGKLTVIEKEETTGKKIGYVDGK